MCPAKYSNASDNNPLLFWKAQPAIQACQMTQSAALESAKRSSRLE
jgi:hypothetical protein